MRGTVPEAPQTPPPLLPGSIPDDAADEPVHSSGQCAVSECSRSDCPPTECASVRCFDDYDDDDDLALVEEMMHAHTSMKSAGTSLSVTPYPSKSGLKASNSPHGTPSVRFVNQSSDYSTPLSVSSFLLGSQARRCAPACCLRCMPKIRAAAVVLVDSVKFAVITMSLTIYALFGDDFRLAAVPKSADVVFDTITILCIVVFSFEIMATCLAKDDYLWSFFFWLDVLPSGTLVLDLTFVADALFCNSMESGSALKSGRAGRAGARAGRTVRIIRLIRLVKVYKLYTKALENRERERERKSRSSTASTASEPGDDSDDDPAPQNAPPEVARASRTSYVSRRTLVMADTTSNASINFEKTITGAKQSDKETRVGKKLSEMTTRRVIVLVLVMLFGLPMFTPDARGYDELKSSSNYGIEIVYEKWRRWCPLNASDPHGLPVCLGVNFVQQNSQGLSVSYQSASMANARFWYERNFLNFLYMHHDSPFAWHLYWIGFQSKRLSDLHGDTVAGQRLGSIAQLAQQVFLSNYSLPPSSWDQTFANPSWVQDIEVVPSSVKDRLTVPWAQKCLNNFFGVSISAEAPLSGIDQCALDDLRCSETQYYVPLARTESERDDLMMVFAFDKRGSMKLEAVLSMVQTIFICFAIAMGAMLFSKDANEMLLKPIARMMQKLNTIKDQPMEATHLGDIEFRRQQFVRSERRQEYQAGGRCWKCWYRMRQKGHNPDPMETIILERTIIKLGGLLAFCFGEAGAETIGHYINKECKEKDDGGKTVDVMVAGTKLRVVLVLCSICELESVTAALQDKVVLFINKVSNILHEIVNDNSGVPSKNTSESFLLVWRFESLQAKDPELDQKLADLSIMAIVRTIAKVNTCGHLAKYREHSGLSEQIRDYQIGLGFGMHCGWAVEGAIGSDYYISPEYLSPNLRTLRCLQACASYYGVHCLISDSLIRQCSPVMKGYCRVIDNIAFNKHSRPMRLYTVDLDVSGLKPEVLYAWDEASVVEKVSRFRIRQTREVMKLQKWSEFYKVCDEFSRNQDIRVMRATFSAEFFKRFFTAYRNYECGEWMVARDMFYTCEYTPNYRTPPVDLSEKNWPMDGPTRRLLRFMRQHDFVSPEGWSGYRELPLKQIDRRLCVRP